MADWVTLGTTQLGADRIATSPTAFALYNNVTALAEGASGAPRLQTPAYAAGSVDQAAMGTAAVGQGELKTSTGSVALGGARASNFTLPGGQYGFYMQVRAQAGDPYLAQIANGISSTSFAANIYLEMISAETGAQAQQRFPTASPPFDLGEGDLQGFIFAWMRGNALLGWYAADVPPWAYNGPTDIRSKLDPETGKVCRRVPKCLALFGMAERGEISEGELLERLCSPEYQGDDLEEITQEIKNRDMKLIPHPFASANPSDSIVLLDPMDERIGALLAAQNAGADVAPVISRIRPDNEPLKRAGPPGVMQCRIKSGPARAKPKKAKTPAPKK